jgi:4-amino-4-deoxy-L-arabinose transferase-like glycosyltransferase
VLGALDPAFLILQVGGLKCLQWLWGHPNTIGWAVTGVAVALGVLGVVLARLRARSLLLLIAGFTLAAWGQLVLWQKGLTPAAVCLYLGGVLCAAVLGRIHPMARLRGFPALPSPADPPARPREVGRSLPLGEWAVVLGLTLLGLLLRGYALTEHPAAFDSEMTSVMLGSYTGFGIDYYMKTELLGTGAGLFHVLTHYVLYRLFGASIFTIRLAAVFWGVLAIPLLYCLARRIAGRGAAIVATVLFIAAPEQLFWSRSENTHFAPVAVLALVTAHLGLSMQERFAPGAVLAVALWMPFSRYSYTPSFVLFTLPLLLAAHAAAFVRGAWQRLRYAAPILLGGLLLWVFSLSVVEFSLQPQHGWRFINPATIKGEVAWRHAIRKSAGPLEVLRTQGLRVVRNAGHVLAGMTYHAKYSTHWYVRYIVGPDRNTMISAGLAVLCALGIGYLLGQVQERRAALLLLWIAIALLPGCMSDEPEARRISVVFPALPIVAGIFVVASARLAREAAGRLAARGAIAALGVGVVLTAFTGLASNLLLPTAPLRLDSEMRFATPLFERCDMVLHNLQGRGHEVAEIGALDLFVRGRPGRCSQLVQEKDWPGAVLLPRCGFSDLVFKLTLSPDERELWRKSYRPTRIGYLLMESRESRPHIELLRRLFPSARTSELPAPTPEERLFAMEVPLSEIEALHAPETSAQSREAAEGVRGGLLTGVEVTVASNTPRGFTIRGGLLLPYQDWYRFRLEPACPGAELTVGTPPSASAEARPLLAGVHPFATRFRAADTCRLPLTLRIESARSPGKPISTTFLAPRVVEAAQAVPVVVIPGYGESKVFARLTDRPTDVGVDGKGHVLVLTFGSEGWKVHRFAPDSREEVVFNTELSPRENHAALSVDAEGNCVLSCASSVEIRDLSGRLLRSWKIPHEGIPSDAALLPDGRIVLCFPNRNSVEIFSRDGRLEGSLASGKRLEAPTGVAVAPDGTIVVVEETGLAHVFGSWIGRWPPAELAAFRVDYPEPPYQPDLAACAFDGTKQVLFPHRSLPAPLIYDLMGRPLMASAPEHDLSAKGLKEAHGFCATRDALYVLDSYPPAVIRVARP